MLLFIPIDVKLTRSSVNILIWIQNEKVTQHLVMFDVYFLKFSGKSRLWIKDGGCFDVMK